MDNFNLPKKGEYPAYYDRYLGLVENQNYCELIEKQVND